MKSTGFSLLPTALIQRNDDLIYSEIDDEIIILNSIRGEYCSLNEVGSLIWKMLDKPLIINELVTSLVSIYEVSIAECEKDLIPFINTLLNDKLILFSNEDK